MIYIVSGAARSGKSMMMQMLQAGGIELVYDEKYLPPNKFNENGFFEYSNPDELLADPDFRKSIDGKAINVVAHQFIYIPYTARKNMKVIWIERELKSIWASQCQVNKSSIVEPILDWDEFLHITGHMINLAMKELKTYNDHVCVSFREMTTLPHMTAKDIFHFVERDFDIEKAAAVVSPRLVHF